MLTIEVEGYAEAKRILDELPNTMQKRMLLAALRASAKPMLQSARSKVPVRTGKLKKQLRTVRYKDRNASKSEVAIAVKPVFERTKKKGAVNEYYGKFIHEGTADPRTSKKGKLLVFDDAQGKKVFVRSVRGIRPTPYLEQAGKITLPILLMAERTAAIFGDELAAAVEKFVNKNFAPVSK